MSSTGEESGRRWAGRPRVAKMLRFFVWLLPIVVSVVATHFISRSFPRPAGLVTAAGWFVALCLIATAILVAVDKLARRLLPLAALLQLSLVFPDNAPSRFKTALRTQTVHQLKVRVDELRQSGLSDDPTVAAETLIELIAALSQHDRLTRGHAERVRAYSRMIGEELKLPEAELDLLQWAGLAHDVGKLFVPGEVLNKTGKLTNEEFDLIKKHPVWGAELCEPLRPWLGDWVDAVGEHHERWDGNGYPNGLAGTDISLAARIVSVADVFDVITSIRSYKSAGSSVEAREELARCAGTQFDERIVRSFLNISLGRLRLAMGPLSWMAQIPIVAQMPLVPVAGAAASVVVTGGAMLVGGTFAEAEVKDVPAAVAAPLPDTTLPEPLPPTTVPLVIVVEPTTTAAPSTDPATTISVSTAGPATTTTTPPDTTTTAPDTTTTTTTTPTTPTPTITTIATTTTPPTTAPPLGPLVALSRAMVVDEDSTIEIDVGDGGGSGVVAGVLGAPDFGLVEHRGGTLFAFRGDDDFNGETSFTYELRDVLGRTSRNTVTLTVNPMPDAPRAADDIATVAENGTVEIAALANDTDPDGDPISIGAVSSTDGVVSINGASITYSPAADTFGTHLIAYIVDDGTGLSDLGTVRVAVTPVNTQPTLVDPGSQSVDENALLSFTASATDADVPADGLTFTLVNGVTPVPPGASINPATGAFTWTPSESQGGQSYSFKVRVTDDGTPNLSADVEVGFMVNDVNVSPVLADPGDQLVDEGVAMSFTLSATDSDLPAQGVSFSSSVLPTGASLDPVSGAFAWTPSESQGGLSVPVTFTVTDDGVGSLAASRSVTLTVTDVNGAPVLDPIGDRVVDEGVLLSFTLAGSDTDLPAQGLTFSSSVLPAGASLDPVSGAFAWTPSEAQGGTGFAVTFTVTDDGAGTLTDEESVTLTATDVNVAPVLADPGAQSVDEGALLSFTASASDADVPADGLTFGLVDGVTPVPSGASINPASGVFAWTPSESQGGTSYSFKVRVTDDGTPNLSADVEVGFVVNDVNEAPVLDPIGDQAVNEGTPLSLTLAASDPDLPTDGLTFTAVGLPAGATLNPTSGALLWTPAEDQGGTDFAVTFTVTDDGLGAMTDEEAVTLSAIEANAAPTVDDPGDQFTALGDAVSVGLTATDSDIPSNNFVFTATGLPAGLAIASGTGVVSGVPTAVESTTVTVTVTETDGTPSNLQSSVSFDWTITTVPTNIVISEIATTGPTGDSDEFIELYNPTSSSIPIAGWELRVSDGDMNAGFTWVLPVGASIGANEHYLITHSSVRVALAADAWYSGTPLLPGAGVALFTGGAVEVDAVGTGPVPWKDGAGSIYGEGTYLPPMSGPGAQSYERKSGVGNCVDTDDNSADFFHNMSSRNPQNSSAPPVVCGTPTPPTPPPAVNHLVVSEFRLDGAGGGNDEFVEIFNPTQLPISLLGYELYNQEGGLEATITAGDLTRLGTLVIGPGQHLLFGSPVYAGATPYSKVDILTVGGIRNVEGMYLVAPGSIVVDAVSTGGTNELEGTPLPPITGRVIHSYERLLGGAGGNCFDTDVNIADFFHNLGSENPQMLSAPATACPL